MTENIYYDKISHWTTFKGCSNSKTFYLLTHSKFKLTARQDAIFDSNKRLKIICIRWDSAQKESIKPPTQKYVHEGTINASPGPLGIK